MVREIFLFNMSWNLQTPLNQDQRVFLSDNSKTFPTTPHWGFFTTTRVAEMDLSGNILAFFQCHNSLITNFVQNMLFLRRFRRD